MIVSLLRKTSFEAHINVRLCIITVLPGIMLTLVGCVSSPGTPDVDNVESLETDKDRYVVYYKTTGEEPVQNVEFQMDGRKHTANNSEESSLGGSGSGGSAGTSESDKDPPEGESARGFEAFQDSYGSPDSDADDGVYDPLEGYNRFMFQVNDEFYTYVLKPTASGWQVISPKPLRQALDRAFDNISFPVRFVNSLLQAEVEGAARELGRFSVNTTVGVAGLFDPGKHWMGWTPNEEDFGQTLGRWGLGPGFPLVWPILGPTNLRDAGARIPDGYLNPISYITPYGLQLGVRALDRVNFSSLKIIGVYDRQKREALDPYTFFRNAYRQNRQSKIAK